MIWIILHIIEIFFWLLLAASGAYILFFALVSMLWKRPISPLSAYLEGQIRSMREPRQFTFLVLYPAYNEDRVIVNSVHTFLGILSLQGIPCCCHLRPHATRDQ